MNDVRKQSQYCHIYYPDVTRRKMIHHLIYNNMKTATEHATITVEAKINAPVKRVWELWTEPNHILHWNHASDDWLTPRAENDLRVGGRFLLRMEARNRSTGFDFGGEYTRIRKYKEIAYTMTDGRKVQVLFTSRGKTTFVTETFEPEHTNSIQMQMTGWQAILDNFKHYVENKAAIDVMRFEVTIDAGLDKVYKTMTDEKKWARWTAPFNPSPHVTSHFRGSWKKGSKMLFIGTEEDGTTGGMVSRIRENIPNRFISIEHQGLYHDGREIIGGPEANGWAGALENYSFSEKNGKTILTIHVDTLHEYTEQFNEAWPEALEILKKMCETE